MDGSGRKLDFDQWLELAKDQVAFESLRRSMINQVIEQAPESQRERLRRLQWRIDQERRLSGSPMGACIRISGMMWKQVLGRGGLLDCLRGDIQCSPNTSNGFRCAKVVPMDRGAKPPQ